MSTAYLEYFGVVVDALRCDWCLQIVLRPERGPAEPRTCSRRCSKALSAHRRRARRSA